MLEVKSISKSYKNNNQVLQEVSFIVPAKEVCCLLEKNGAGKSTIINICAGIIKPDKGGILIDGQPLRKEISLNEQQIGVNQSPPKPSPSYGKEFPSDPVFVENENRKQPECQ
ncbi:ABC transporter [Dyadobacter soli]|uniref:ABC transporter n=1 Tax=Dyadobacter soli TaxID=659014 RepID=A0A1G7VC12_9BACT|nr:ATP-binding cassette domain-containing protein [Dyadobacter soli]SDG57284.1 ABC transporter [Dyadobacter soli]